MNYFVVICIDKFVCFSFYNSILYHVKEYMINDAPGCSHRKIGNAIIVKALCKVCIFSKKALEITQPCVRLRQ